ncbi:MAG: HAD hydrolase-like protein [Ruminococcus sp.]
MKYKYILLDLDGTIAETAEGIRNSFEKTLKALGADMIDLSDYTKYIGPPLLDTLKNLCKLPPELCEKGYSIYKDFYWNEGRFMIKPYEGIELVLKELRQKNVKIAVCTSKLEESAIQVMKDIKMDGYFDEICGSDRESTRKDKKDLIPYAIEKLGGNMAEKGKAVMLGDTWYDAKGAKECGVDFIACSYGYGANEEMAKYNPVAWADSPMDILEILK